MTSPLIVTRHKALVELLAERGVDTSWVITHVEDPSILDGQDVIGVLPMHLAARCKTITEIPLNYAPEDRGKELDLARLKEIAGEAVTYRVIKEGWECLKI